MDPILFCNCVIFLDGVFKISEVPDFDLKSDPSGFLKVLDYSVIVDVGDEDELPGTLLRGLKELSKDAARLVVHIRNSEWISKLTFDQERFLYRTLSKVYKLNG